ncbi:MAG: glycosyltransferase family 2 protein [Desulfobacterales bacterium]|nr:glycosyltransferase family 2 protein [Desulfobacterales bacterium]
MMKTTSCLMLSIVMLNYNRLHETQKTMNHLKQLVQDREDIEVIAVDNASQDQTLGYLNSQKDWVTVLPMKTNKGIAGLNKGFNLAKGKYIFVIDDDSCPINSETIDLSIQILEKNTQIGVVACRIESETGDPIKTWHLPDNINEPAFSMAFVGCGFIIRRHIFEYMGWYPAHFFLYQNEIQIAIQLCQLGYSIFYEPKCRVVHRESSIGRSSWRRVYFPTRNTLWIIRKYCPFPLSIIYMLSRMLIGLLRAIQYRELSTYLYAVKHAFMLPIQKEYLTKDEIRQFDPFWQQNNVIYQLKHYLVEMGL